MFIRAHGAKEYCFLWNTGIATPIITQCGQTGDNPSHYRNRRACTHACDVGTGCKYWTGGVVYILDWCVILDRCVELDWYVACTGLVCWTGA